MPSKDSLQPPSEPSNLHTDAQSPSSNNNTDADPLATEKQFILGVSGASFFLGLGASLWYALRQGPASKSGTGNPSDGTIRMQLQGIAARSTRSTAPIPNANTPTTTTPVSFDRNQPVLQRPGRRSAVVLALQAFGLGTLLCASGTVALVMMVNHVYGIRSIQELSQRLKAVRQTWLSESASHDPKGTSIASPSSMDAEELELTQALQELFPSDNSSDAHSLSMVEPPPPLSSIAFTVTNNNNTNNNNKQGSP